MVLAGWQTALVVAGSVVGGVALLWPVGIWWEVGKCQKPKYDLLRPLAASAADRKRYRLGYFQRAELRRYAPMLVAEVEVEGTMRETSSAGFRKIAKFIFGGNVAAGGGSEAVAMTSPVRQELMGPSEPIAMTSPVVMKMQSTESLAKDAAGKVRMSFVMPSKYTKDTLPRPNDASVEIKEIPAHTIAALSFRGHVGDRAAVEEKKRQLLAIMEGEGLAPKEGAAIVLHQYHPPFTYGLQRVNEVCLEVKE